MRSLLSLGKTVGRFAVRSLVGGFAISGAIGFLAPAARGEMIEWIDPPAARTVGEAEACGLKSLDVATDTVTRGSLAVLAAGTGPAADVGIEATTSAEPTALHRPATGGVSHRVGDAPTDVWNSHTERMEWLSVEPTETVSIDPYPTWSAASVVVDDIVTMVASSDPFQSPATPATMSDYRTGVAALGRRFWRW